MATAPLDPDRLAGVLRPRQEAAPLPAEAYLDPAVLAWEQDHFFESSWVCVGREEDAAQPGDVFTGTVGSESLLMVRGEDRMLRGFFNVCQHRGTRLVMEPARSGDGPLICPYHSWTYGLDGRLRAAQHMAEAKDFDRRSVGLSPVATECLGGWVFANVSGTAGSLREYLGNFPGRIERYDCGSLRRVARHEYDVEANWKILSENYQECYHCPTIHPELSRITPYDSGGSDEESHGRWLGGPMDLREGCTTMSVSGVTDRPPIPGLRPEDHGQVFYYSVLPNLWISLHPDYVMTHTVWPAGPSRSHVVCEWLFHPSAIDAKDFDPADAVEFWDLVNGQDWKACERVQLGIGSRGFAGGRFSDLEGTIHDLAALLARSYLEGRLVRADETGVSPIA
jgi:phenylpropionate dioxygenase-like ring-hydroxylating dioxygenase large terminal subunit